MDPAGILDLSGDVWIAATIVAVEHGLAFSAVRLVPAERIVVGNPVEVESSGFDGQTGSGNLEGIIDCQGVPTQLLARNTDLPHQGVVGVTAEIPDLRDVPRYLRRVSDIGLAIRQADHDGGVSIDGQRDVVSGVGGGHLGVHEEGAANVVLADDIGVESADDL